MNDSRLELKKLKQRIAELENQIETNSVEADMKSTSDPSPLVTLYEWQAPDRTYTSHGKGWYTLVTIIAVLGMLIALIFQNFFFVLVIMVVVLLLYAVDSVPPQMVTNTITNKGIKTQGELYFWGQIDGFWVSEKNSQLIVSADLVDKSGRIILLVGGGDINKILQSLMRYEDYKEPKGFGSVLAQFLEGRRKKITELIK